MLFAILFALNAFSLSAHADSMRFDCKLYYPAGEQGQERFMKVAFPEEGGALLEISDLTSPYRDIAGTELKLARSFYTDDDEMVGAAWTTKDGKAAADLALAFFGTHWVGHLMFHQDVKTPELTFKNGEGIAFRCSENPY